MDLASLSDNDNDGYIDEDCSNAQPQDEGTNDGDDEGNATEGDATDAGTVDGGAPQDSK